jgi:anhydro-N-acetylmuramic acid kinase
MFYSAIGIMSGSSLDGLDIVYAEFDERGGEWGYQIKASDCYEYENEWLQKLKNAISLNTYDYLLLHSAYGKYIGQKINQFIEEFSLQHQVQLIASHGHTTFHAPQLGMTAQLGDGAAIAAITGINTVSDLRAMDVALGGQGAPIVPVGEKLLWNDFDFFLNIGGIANITSNQPNGYIAFDICPANRVLNLLAAHLGKTYDEGGAIASSGKIHTGLLTRLNALDYYKLNYPKSLANDFGIESVYPLILSFNLPIEDALRTYTEHISLQLGYAVNIVSKPSVKMRQLLLTGGGAHNSFLVERIKHTLKSYQIQTVVPEVEIINYKEALIMALLGVLRWREENTVLSSVTGASRSSIGGAVWMGQEA